jgi:hypothetical protein
MLGVESRTSNLRGVAKHLIERVGKHRAQRIGCVHLRIECNGPGLARRTGIDGARETLAALGLAAHVEPQAVTRDPAPGEVDQRERRSTNELELELAHRLASIARADRALVECQLDGCAALAHAARRAAHIGAEPLDPRHRGRIAEHNKQTLEGWRARMPLHVERWLAPAGTLDHDFVLEPVHRLRRAGLERLHPARALSAQPQGDAGGREGPIGRIEVHRLQPHAARRR